MLRFKEFNILTEGKYPNWLKIVVGGMILKVRNLNQRIESEDDVVKQNRLISQQNNLISYIGGLGIAVGSTDKVLMNRLKSSIGVGKKR